MQPSPATIPSPIPAQRGNPQGVRARPTDHAVRRYAERALGVAVEGDDDAVALRTLVARRVPVGAIRRRLSIVGGLGVANGANAVVEGSTGLKLVLVDGNVVTVLARRVRADLLPSGPSSHVPPRRQRTCLDMELDA